MSPDSPPRSSVTLPLLLVVAFAAVALMSLRGEKAPAPLGHDAPADVFAAARARDVLTRILGDERPHPTGSAANALVRDRIVAEFATLGLEAEVQRRFVCGTQTCATVENILARLPGAKPEGAVLLSAHYDSVAAGPGAGDDGAGVAAVIEAARALKAGPPLPRDVWLLVNDGEEIDLLGAEAFVREPQFAAIASVVNVEARGTEGGSLLIETQPGNAAIVPVFGGAVARPAGTSLDYEIYKTLPNDTDFTVYRREGRSGTSFAIAQGAARYHTPLDDLAHLDDGSLQHHGDNLLGMARALAGSEGALTAKHDAVFFGVFGRGLASWPVTWNLALLVAGLLAWIALGVRLVRAKEVRVARAIGAGFGMIGLLLVVAALGFGLHLALGALGATPAPWTAQESHLVDGFAALGLAAMVLVGVPMTRRLGAGNVALASLLPFALIAIATVFAMPGAAHVGLLPLLAGALAGHAWPRRPVPWSALAAIVAVMLWFPYVVYAYVAVGHDGLPAGTLLLGLALLPLLPALAGLGRGAWWLGGVATIGTLAFATMAVTAPKFDEDVPRPVNLFYVGGGESPRVYLDPYGDLPGGFHAQNGFAQAEARALPWSPFEALPGPAGPALPPPVVEVLRDEVRGDRRHVELRLRSARGATQGGLRLPASVDFGSVRVDGVALVPPRHDAPARAAYRGVTRIGLPADGVRIAFEGGTEAPLVLYAVDSSPGLPQELVNVAKARDAIAVPIHGGDSSLAWAKVELPLRKPTP